MRATLHDELMRDAGFDVEYYREVARRRERRERRLRPARVALRFVGRRFGVDAESRTEPSRPKPRVADRPTLNDRLMHEAGFETDYDRYLAWRRQRRRRTQLTTVSLVLVAAGVVETIAWLLPAVPKPLLVAALAIPVVIGVVRWLVRRIVRRREEADDRPGYARAAVLKRLAKRAVQEAPS